MAPPWRAAEDDEEPYDPDEFVKYSEDDPDPVAAEERNALVVSSVLTGALYLVATSVTGLAWLLFMLVGALAALLAGFVVGERAP